MATDFLSPLKIHNPRSDTVFKTAEQGKRLSANDAAANIFHTEFADIAIINRKKRTKAPKIWVNT
jgi:hypothetical protein